MELEFSCACCGQVHRGVPTFAAEAPLAYYQIPECDRDTRCQLTSDDCVIDDAQFFVHGCIETGVNMFVFRSTVVTRCP